MNYFNETEKSLKRYLKSKVSITMATVVGFLIAGTVSFGATTGQQNVSGVQSIEADIADGGIKIYAQNSNSNITTSGSITNTNSSANYETVNNTGKKIGRSAIQFYQIWNDTTLNNSADLTADTGISIGVDCMIPNKNTNTKNITINNSGNITAKVSGIYADANYYTTGSRYQDKVKVTNSGNITVEGDGDFLTGVYLNTRYQESSKGTYEQGEFVNDGTITVKAAEGKDGEFVGIGVYGNSKATNNGTVSVTGNGAIGVLAENTTGGKTEFINNGIITAEGENSVAIKSTIDGFALKLAENSHVEGLIDLDGDNSNVSIFGVGAEGNPEVVDLNVVSGTVDIGVTIQDLTPTIVELQGEVTEPAESTDIAVVEVRNNANNTLVNNAIINGKTGIAAIEQGGIGTQTYTKDLTLKIENGENGVINATEGGIRSNGYWGWQRTEIVNNGEINVRPTEVSPEGNSYFGIYSAVIPYDQRPGDNQRGVVENNKNITVDLTSVDQEVLAEAYGNGNLSVYGLRVHEAVEGSNKGNITVNSIGGMGVVVTTGTEGSSTDFTNLGNINVTGKDSVGVLVKNSDSDNKLGNPSFINDSTGVIKVNGDNAIAVKVNGANAEFTNKGMLVLGEEGTNKKAIVVENGGVATNNGIVQVLGTELDGVTSGKEALDKLFAGVEEANNKGIIVDKDGNALFAGSEDTTVTGETTTDVLESLSGVDGSLTLKGDVTLSAGNSNPDVTTDVLNVIGGTTTIASGNEVNIEAENINLDAEGQLAISTGATLGLSNGTLNKVTGTEEGESTAAIINEGTLNLTNMDVTGDITGTSGTVNAFGENTIDGKVEGTFNIGNVEQLFFRAANINSGKTNVATVTSNSSFGGDINIGADAQLVLVLGKDNENALFNSTGITISGTNNDDIALDTSSLNTTTENLKDGITISLGSNNGNTFKEIDVTTTSGDNGIYVVDKSNLGTSNEVTLTYNQELYKDNTTINNMNKEAYAVNSFFSQDVATREKQLDTLYANNIYSETARAAYDMMKLNEETVLSLNTDAKVGEWTAAGKALYNKTEYDRAGTVGEYSAETETSGLMAGLEYGVDETTSVGVAFSGAYQDIDTDGGSAEGNVFYLGGYAKKQIGKLSLTAGLGYQYGDYDADNTAGAKVASASYDVNAYSAYVEGRYGIDLGDNVTLEPKLKLGYTYVDQDNVSDDYFKLNDAELSTFDAEVGADLVKTVALEAGKLDVRFGASYVRAFGDTDDKFTGSFAGSTGSFDVLGAELAEDTAKFDLGVEVTKDSGVFYNVGGTLRVGSDNTRDYGVKLGAGYKF